MADLDPDIEKRIEDLQIGSPPWSEEMKEHARRFFQDPAAQDGTRDDMIRSQKSLISSDLKRLPSTDEVQGVLFKIQDLLAPFLAEEDEKEYEGDPSSGHLSRAGQIEANAKERRLKYGPDEDLGEA
jgi:hypothetical protein